MIFRNYIRKTCGFYVSEYHMVTMLLPHIVTKVEKGVKIDTILNKNIKQEISNKEMNQESNKGMMVSGMGKLLRGMGRGIGMLWRGFLGLCVWGLRTAWNLGWLMLSVFCACLAMIALAGFGTLAVLLFQGYPSVRGGGTI